MAANDKISKALKAAMTYLGNSVSAWKKKEENLFADNLWHAAAELEYVLFLFSLMFQNEDETAKWKPNPDLKKMETGTLLTEAQRLLKDAEKHMTDKKLLGSYKSAYVARHYLLKAQEDLAKKKREALKKK
ncbi:MAG: hypothetical protein K6T73_04370 [Candidatus Bathyarchaeota archaeon]|nr:hypothetical protein [Candidatus Bathyarchaeota archaeon]